MTQTQAFEMTTDPARIIGYQINELPPSLRCGARAFVQPDGALRIVARSVAGALIAYSRAKRIAGLQVATVQVRVRHTETVVTCDGS